jgi:hypothetical protein
VSELNSLIDAGNLGNYDEEHHGVAGTLQFRNPPLFQSLPSLPKCAYLRELEHQIRIGWTFRSRDLRVRFSSNLRGEFQAGSSGRPVKSVPQPNKGDRKEKYPRRV